MQRLFFLIAGIFFMTTQAQAQQPAIGNRRFSPDQVRSVAPALEQQTQQRLYGDVWN